MKVLDLFSGIGGFSLGLERAGMETIAFCEIEDYPVSKLNKHWPSIPVHRDIRKLDGKQYRDSVDVVCGGFPCQPFSVAGKQRGKEDDRHLWPEMLRIIKEVRPTWVIGENVAGFIRMALDDVLLDLETEGYTTQSFVIPACAVGAVHRRDRVWIVGYSEHAGRNGSKDGQSDTQGNDRDKKGQGKVIESAGPGCEGSVDANPNSERTQGAANSRSSKGGWPNSVEQPGRLCGFARQEFEPIGTPTQFPVCHRDDGVPVELAGLGIIGGKYVKGSYKISKPERSESGWKVLRAVWENRKLAEASPDLYIKRMCDSLPEMPYKPTHGRWFLGERIEKDKGLRDMWEEFYSKPFKEAQNLQQRVFERIREIERKETMATDRVKKLKALGNAVIPQIPELIGRAIMQKKASD